MILKDFICKHLLYIDFTSIFILSGYERLHPIISYFSL